MHVPTRYIPHAVALTGAGCVALWLTGLDHLTHLGRNDTMMMPTTGIGFFVAAVAIQYEPVRTHAARFGTGALCVAALGNALVPLITQAAIPDPAHDLTMNIATALTFAALAVYGLCRTFTKGEDCRPVVGACVALVGVCAIVGHAIDLPAAFFRDPGRSNGMALHTAALFLLLGARLVLPPKGKA